MASSSRMTSYQRREQLIAIGRALFASKGFEAVSVEEIAASAKVSKPIVYEHFGGKEGLYAVVVDREMRALTDALIGSLSDTDAHPRQIVERAALALLTYIEENPEGFQVLVRDSPSTDPTGSFSSLLGDVSSKVEQILVEWFKRQHLPVKSAPYYAQMLVGMTVFTGQYWADRPKLGKEQLAALIVNLAWHGLSRLEAKPELRYEGSKAKRAREAAEKAEQKAEQKAKRANGNSEQPENGDDSADDADKSMAANSAATGHDTSGDGNNDTDNNDPGEDKPAR
ncbi:TetR/AcrR family transcriptional regulator [Bifidobacterium thermophilum]|uniref:TetR/AcrR family transcriptional regulator n=2 Tax=Bifidobacterium TaxID=1678 RepID=A0A7X9NTN9_9BIFI|nr:TetR/AcrR family transcriptional regulator [Bifidobacterium thermophilum]